MSFLCAICSEVWEGRKPFYVTKENVMCGGSVYAGIGSRKMSKEEYDAGASTFIGPHKAYASREVLRRVNQQIPHHLKHHKYLVIGKLEDVENPDLVMFVAEAHKIMRLCKVYTWKTGELVQSLQGTAWCTSALPTPYRTKTMTFTMGDPPSRNLMQLKPGEMYGVIHYELLPLIVENFENISTGEVG